MADYIVANPDVLSGKPHISGTRLSVQFLLELLAGGATQQQILEAYPHLTAEALTAAIEYAADAVQSDVVWEGKVSA